MEKIIRIYLISIESVGNHKNVQQFKYKSNAGIKKKK